jgi:hypothetical protein
MATTTAPKTTASVTKTGNTVQGRFALKNLPTLDVTEASKPLFAFVGVADYALEQVKDVPALYAAEAKKAQARLADVPAQFKTIPSQVEKANKKALELYTELTERGERLVTQIRRQPSTQATIAEGKAAVKKAEAATRSAKRSVKAGEKAVEDAASKLG